MTKPETLFISKLSPAQKKAVTESGAHLCVSAGAGSGKTTVLVERFFYLVREKKLRPEEIAAVTFTDKAANQLKEKLVKKFTDADMPAERQALESAYIGTIHGLASRLLKENPVEAGVDPEFRVLESEEADVVMDHVLENLLGETAFQEDIFNLLSVYSEEKIRACVKEIYGQAQSFGVDVLELAKGALPPHSGPAWEACAQSSEDLLGVIGKAGKVFDQNRASARELLDFARGKKEFTAEELKKMQGMAKLLKKQGAQAETVGVFRELFDTARHLEWEKLTWHFRETFLLLYGEFAGRYQILKNERGLLDFDDLLVKAERLFSGQDPVSLAVKKRYQRKIKHWMVDEYQDTSRLQDRWIGRLSEAGRLFLVGDAKQSIYLFRNADLEGFLEKEKSFAENGQNKRLGLNDNYRSRRDILEFVNAFFRELWSEDEFHFERLEARKKYPDKTAPSVEIIRVPRSDDDSGLERARVKEAKCIAARIQEILSDKKALLQDEAGVPRRVTCGDIAILFRRMTHSGIYEQELRQAGIPYELARGRGFFARQEVADLMHFLTLLLHPERDISLAAVLRSPLFAVSEDALYWMADKAKAQDRNTPLFHFFTDGAEDERLALDDAEKIKHFHALWAFLGAQKDKLRISEMLLRILRETHYDIVLRGKKDGARKQANVLKLVDMARGFEARDLFDLADFIHYVKEMRAREVKEAEARAEMEEPDTVKVMTIHSAKGLEFPVVIVADLGAEQRSDSREPFVFCPERALAWRVFDSAGGGEETHSYLRREKENKEKERAEQKRLFYVAMTRAKEYLILCGAGKEEDKDKSFSEMKSWMSWLDKILGLPSAAEQIDYVGMQIKLQRAESGGARATEKKTVPAAETRKNILQWAAGLEENPQREEAFAAALGAGHKEFFATRDLPVYALLEYLKDPQAYALKYEWLYPVEMPGNIDGDEVSDHNSHCDQAGRERVSATPPKADPSSGGEAISDKKSGIVRQRTDLISKQTSPARIRRIRLPAGKAGNDGPASRQGDLFSEIPLSDVDLLSSRGALTRDPGLVSAGMTDEAGEHRVDARAFGVIFHNAAQQIAPDKLFSEEWEKISRQAAAALSAAAVKDLEKCLHNFMESPWGKALRNLECYRELPFILRLPRGKIRGKIDLLIRENEQDCVIVDYKTARRPGNMDVREKEFFKRQLAVYALAVHAADKALRPRRGVLYFPFTDTAEEFLLDDEFLDNTRRELDRALEEIALHKREKEKSLCL